MKLAQRTWKPPLWYSLPVSELGPPVKVGASVELQPVQMSCKGALNIQLCLSLQHMPPAVCWQCPSQLAAERDAHKRVELGTACAAGSRCYCSSHASTRGALREPQTLRSW